MLLLLAFLQRIPEPTLSPPLFSIYLFILEEFNCRHSLWDLKGTFDPREDEVFDWVISDLVSLNNPDIPALLHCSFPDISFAPSSLAPGRCFSNWALITSRLYQRSSFSALQSQRTSPLRFSESFLV